MTGTIFDLIEEEIPQGKEGFFEIAKRAPQPKDNSFLSSVSDYGKTILKGSIEGLSRLGGLMGPLQDIHGKPYKEQLEKQTESLEEILPTDEGYVQSSIRRGLREAPSVLSFPGSTLGTLPRSIAAGFLGEAAKELGAPEWAQTAAELTAFIGPNITKKILASGKNQEIIEAARKFGLTDEAITPLIQSDFKQKWLSKLSPKRGATEKALKTTKGQLSDAYSTVEKSEIAKTRLSESDSEKFISSIDDILFEIPSEVRGKIKADYADLLSKPISGETLINFWGDINHAMGPGSKQLSILKNPIQKALVNISPELSKDFEMINKLYSKYYNIAGKLKPNITSDIISAAESIGIAGSALIGITTGHFPFLVEILSEKAAKKLAQQMLINPHMQQLSKKMVVALNQNKFALAKNISEQFFTEIEKFDPESAQKLKNLTDEELEEFFNQKK